MILGFIPPGRGRRIQIIVRNPRNLMRSRLPIDQEGSGISHRQVRSGRVVNISTPPKVDWGEVVRAAAPILLIGGAARVLDFVLLVAFAFGCSRAAAFSYVLIYPKCCVRIRFKEIACMSTLQEYSIKIGRLNSKEDAVSAPAVSFSAHIDSVGVGWPLILMVTAC